MSWLISSKFSWPIQCSILRLRPVKKLSATITSCPCNINRSTRWEPTKLDVRQGMSSARVDARSYPAPPVTYRYEDLLSSRSISSRTLTRIRLRSLYVRNVTSGYCCCLKTRMKKRRRMKFDCSPSFQDLYSLFEGQDSLIFTMDTRQ